MLTSNLQVILKKRNTLGNKARDLPIAVVTYQPSIADPITLWMFSLVVYTQPLQVSMNTM